MSLKYTDQQLADAVAQSTCMQDVLRLMGACTSGASHARMTKRAKALGLDISHFCTYKTGKHSSYFKPSSEVLVLRTSGDRQKAEHLRRSLIDIGRVYQCESCEIQDWNGQPLVLQVDHQNGNWLDDRAENLRFLCPNCHSQTATWCRNRKSK